MADAGASNFFVVWRTKKGQYQLATAETESGSILERITRRSILDLAQHYQNEAGIWSLNGQSLAPLTLVEWDFSSEKIREAVVDGRLVEAFAAGTAVSGPRVYSALISHEMFMLIMAPIAKALC